jgi:DNA (cytosine-5)-methyltransferase 1
MNGNGSAENRKLFPELFGNPWPTGYPDRGLESETVAEDESGNGPTALEICAGAGGQALGLERAGIRHAALVELDPDACATLRLNRPHWNAMQADLNRFDASAFRGVEIVAGGLPCPPFSVAGKQLGHNDERNLFPAMLRIVDQVRPQAVMIENVRGILEPMFDDYRREIASELKKHGYQTGWKLLNASDFGVPQLRPRVLFIALRSPFSDHFAWPDASRVTAPAVGDVLYDLMAARGWNGALQWRGRARGIAPTVVGGSRKHGGPDLGPTRARLAWAALDVDGLGIAGEPPDPDFSGMPRLTVRMVARIQGFPDEWQFYGKKTAAYRQVGNAFPPPFARAVGRNLVACLSVPRLVGAPR